MRNKNYKGRCEKRSLSKCKDVCRTYDVIQSAYADKLESDEEIVEIRVNVVLDGLGLDKQYTSDFVCVRADGDFMVAECVQRSSLTKPLTIKLLDASRQYWKNHGITDWRLVINETTEDR